MPIHVRPTSRDDAPVVARGQPLAGHRQAPDSASLLDAAEEFARGRIPQFHGALPVLLSAHGGNHPAGRVRGKEIHAECVEPDMYAAIDALADKLDRQVLKLKEKRNGQRHTAVPVKRVATSAAHRRKPPK